MVRGDFASYYGKYTLVDCKDTSNQEYLGKIIDQEKTFISTTN
jgi:hypothetical protein